VVAKKIIAMGNSEKREKERDPGKTAVGLYGIGKTRHRDTVLDKPVPGVREKKGKRNNRKVIQCSLRGLCPKNVGGKKLKVITSGGKKGRVARKKRERGPGTGP